ncbi:MAG: bifunctional glutamate N-acetyltransferase/amino-acid acetyltransferase ArgJ [Alphaproteobacteria bacterium]|nr:bifunctional glutamate N-acetyltransferase/amino-acid acetyltransferase ArgJ [Alphaproteobacteria bacterium]
MPVISPLAPAAFPVLPPIAGLDLAGIPIGLKRRPGARDLLLARFAPGTSVAGVLTRSLCASAPVEWCRAALRQGKARVLVVNSGNSNAFTGQSGRDLVADTVAAAAGLFGCAKHEVFVASTGVIGQPVARGHIAAKLPDASRALGPDAWADAAAAIMTTDTFPKASIRRIKIGGVPVTIAGIAKGSGMIAPDMATMLSFVFTDAAVTSPVLQQLLKRAADRSFNCITVDSDTSTSDTLLAFATGQARHAPIDSIEAARGLSRALDEVCIDLAQQIVRDGEGAQKFVTVEVTGAASPRAAKTIALSIANSPLVKTAIAGEDANWGRIVMAVGKAGEKAERDKLKIAIGGVPITEDGQARQDYDEAPVAAHMKTRDIRIAVDVGIGRGKARVWTCDLTHGYIDINGSYRS